MFIDSLIIIYEICFHTIIHMLCKELKNTSMLHK